MKSFISHLVKLGFTNRLALLLVIVEIAGLIGGFYLAVMSIRHNYTGALVCWTVCFTPLGYGIQQVLGKIVDKSKAENTAGGIKYDSAIKSCEKDL